MLITTFELSECIVPPTDNDLQVFSGAPIPPIERVGTFSPNQFEDFINEWATACLKSRYIWVRKIGGANDKGRDIVAEIADGEYDYYQCKHYEKPIAPSDIWLNLENFAIIHTIRTTHCPGVITLLRQRMWVHLF